MKYQELLNQISQGFQDIIGSNLVGVYVHGSIALNCFNWDKSDIDYLVVIKEALSQEKKLEIMKHIIEWNASAPPKGMEMSIVRKEHCINFIYPTPFELHFANPHIKWFQDSPEDYCRLMNGVDKDLAAHFTITKKAGIVLCGEPIEAVFGVVPKEAYIDSILADIDFAKDTVESNPMYLILTLCRILAYLKDELILSKEEGGKWGLANLDKQYTDILTKALQQYQSDEELIYEKEELDCYSDYMVKLIHSYSNL